MFTTFGPTVLLQRRTRDTTQAVKCDIGPTAHLTLRRPYSSPSDTRVSELSNLPENLPVA